MKKWAIGLPIAAMILFLVLFMMMSLFMVASAGIFITGGDEDAELMNHEVAEEGTAQVNEAVERYRPLFEEYAEEHGIPEYTELLMAKTEQESSGQLSDVMQSSESLGLPRNTISDPERSIDVGVEYFASTLDDANGDVELALQSYNMGHGFIDYVEDNNDGEYSQELAQQFGEERADELGWSNYGDENYVDHVMRYLDGFDSETAEFEGSEGDWQPPVENVNVTSDYGMRHHPIHNEERMHNGTDFGCTTSDGIYSVQDGLVVDAVNSNTGLGNHVTIQHNDGEYSTYGHLSSLDVSNGDEVDQGERIGMCGSTGASTAPHLHLEHRTSQDGDHEDPMDTLDIY